MTYIDPPSTSKVKVSPHDPRVVQTPVTAKVIPRPASPDPTSTPSGTPLPLTSTHTHPPRVPPLPTDRPLFVGPTTPPVISPDTPPPVPGPLSPQFCIPSSLRLPHPRSLHGAGPRSRFAHSERGDRRLDGRTRRHAPVGVRRAVTAPERLEVEGGRPPAALGDGVTETLIGAPPRPVPSDPLTSSRDGTVGGGLGASRVWTRRSRDS